MGRITIDIAEIAFDSPTNVVEPRRFGQLTEAALQRLCEQQNFLPPTEGRAVENLEVVVDAAPRTHIREEQLAEALASAIYEALAERM